MTEYWVFQDKSFALVADGTRGPAVAVAVIAGVFTTDPACRITVPVPSYSPPSRAVHGQHLVEPFEDASGDTGRLLVKPTGEMAQQPLGFIGIVGLPAGAIPALSLA